MKFLLRSLQVSTMLMLATTATAVDCKHAKTTQDINYCQGLELDKLNNSLRIYYETSVQLNQNDELVVQKLMDSQARWEDYKSSYCGALYNKSRFGTTSGAAHLKCQQKLVKQRTLNLWQDFLSGPDGRSSDLPKPD